MELLFYIGSQVNELFESATKHTMSELDFMVNIPFVLHFLWDYLAQFDVETYWLLY